MEFKNIELLRINSILNQFADKKLPQRISFAITKNIMIIGNEIQCYNKEIEKIMKKYNEYFLKDDNGDVKYNRNGVPLVCDEHREDFLSELNELLNISVKVDLYNIEENVFDYDDVNGRFDPMSAKDIVELQSIICKKNNNE